MSKPLNFFRVAPPPPRSFSYSLSCFILVALSVSGRSAWCDSSPLRMTPLNPLPQEQVQEVQTPLFRVPVPAPAPAPAPELVDPEQDDELKSALRNAWEALGADPYKMDPLPE